MSNFRIAMMFPGQGSQASGMMTEWRADANHRNVVEQTFEQASDALSLDMWALMQDDRLNDTEFTQPAILTASIAIWRVLKDVLPYTPTYLAGHSLGEYSALVAADVIHFEDALKLVQARGKLMSEAVVGMQTQMAAILGLEDEQVAALCEHMSVAQSANPANFNSPGQVVVAGTTEGVQAVLAEAQALGAKCVPLKVSVPSHCALMRPASEKLAALLHDTPFASPKISVIQNVNAKIFSEVGDIKDALIAQLSMPVQWSATMQSLADKKVDVLVECGYGNILSNLAKRQNVPLPAFATDKPEKITKLLEKLNES